MKTDDTPQITDIVAELLTEFPNLHGTVMIAKGNKILWHHGFSYADAPLKTDKNSQYLIASITKQFTAAALLKTLYDTQQNVLENLQKPVTSWLPSDHQIWNGAMPEWANLVTLHHLLTHTSGIRSFHERLDFTPSEKYAYANIGYTLLGAVIQTITSQSLDVYFEKVLFKPAGMSDTGLPLSGKPIDLQNNPKFQKLSLGFERTVAGEHTKYSTMSDKLNFDKPSTAGGIISTTHDLVKWNHALYQGKIIPTCLVEIMTTRHIQKETHPYYDGFEPLWYGYGLDIYEQENTKIYQHCGGIAGYQSKMSYNPQTTITIINLSNVMEDSPPIFAFVNRLQALLIENQDNQEIAQ
jgi:CubicO group peptidase (beta-lactamase class C family)